MRFHILGLPHTVTSRGYSVCAFTAKVANLCRMLHERDHEVIHYGREGSEVPCAEHVAVLDDATFRRVHGDYDYREAGFVPGRDNDAYKAFAANAALAILGRAKPGDFLLCPFGLDHQPIAEVACKLAPGLIPVESGIGYDHTFAPFRVFESYAWLHYTYGKEGRSTDPLPSWYDAVIPNAYDTGDFPFAPEKGGYAIFLGRPNPLKGLGIARDACAAAGVELYTAGQGPTEAWGPNHLGVLSAEERARWVGGARCLLAPTRYVEPWGNVVLEAALLGTPVVATDWGAFSENVVHGATGWRCRTLEQFAWAVGHAGDIDPAACRAWGENFSLERVGAMYEEYFEGLARLHTDPKGWYAANEGRAGLDWLRRYGA